MSACPARTCRVKFTITSVFTGVVVIGGDGTLMLPWCLVCGGRYLDQRSDHVKQEGLHDIVDAVVEDATILERLSDKVLLRAARPVSTPECATHVWVATHVDAR